ncbi:phosphate signaling complex protein PhoU [Luteimicrobium subarcticum]|uniref:Phosphate-specific transport system accessory protein PhoU n=1 Tax=Luteimicrobium subarcticum TaxID=620910 RepID=A0A2M8WSQ2_9MICO|nr:phosphate signaling complex protein PhoU [Luteimicrobium subarcticum]PJI93959.1 phosphate transport system protein [Luteimicrobium subarcticum]
MREIFEAELQQLGDDLRTMSEKVAQAIEDAGRALLDADLSLAQSVIASDRDIDDRERALDDECVRLLAQQAPVATDLRIVVSSLRMSASLERMGDLARHVAQVARRTYPKRALPEAVVPTFTQMNDAAVRVARRVTELLETRDLALALTIERDDDLLDLLHEQTFGVVLSPDWIGSVQETVDVTLASRFYERFGDHAVSIARRVSYLVTGDAPVELG